MYVKVLKLTVEVNLFQSTKPNKDNNTPDPYFDVLLLYLMSA